MGARAALDGCGKSDPHRDSIPGLSSPKQVAIPTTLSQTRQPSIPVNYIVQARGLVAVTGASCYRSDRCDNLHCHDKR